MNPKRTEPASSSKERDAEMDGVASIELARLIRVLQDFDPVAARIARWRYLDRRFSDQQIAERLGWRVERVIDACDRALMDLRDDLEQPEAA